MHREGPARLGEDGDEHALADQAPELAAFIERHGEPRVPAATPVFAAIVEAICHQQLSMAAGGTVHGRVVDALGDPPTPEAVLARDPETLEACGLSARKAGYVVGIAEAFETGAIDEDALARWDVDRVREALRALDGVGAWTADIVLLFALHRPDVFPAGDAGLQDAAHRLLGFEAVPSADELAERALEWRPYRSLAAWYLWTERDRRLREAGKR